MNLKNMRHGLSRATLIVAAIGALLGLLLIVIPVDFLLNLIFFVMGIVIIAVSLPAFISLLPLRHTTAGRISLISTAVVVAAGFLMIFWHSDVLLIIVGIAMIGQPIFAIATSDDRQTRLKAELPKLIVGIVLLVLGPAKTLDLLFDIAGIGLIVLSIVYLIWMYVVIKKSQNTTGARIFVDTDGNGTIDAVYVDTDKNGEADTATTYREQK